MRRDSIVISIVKYLAQIFQCDDKLSHYNAHYKQTVRQQIPGVHL